MVLSTVFDFIFTNILNKPKKSLEYLEFWVGKFLLHFPIRIFLNSSLLSFLKILLPEEKQN